MDIDVSTDYLYFDWLQNVNYQSRVDDVNFAADVVVRALRRMDAKSFGAASESFEVALHECVWEVWAHGMATPIIPKRGDKFTAGSRVWIVEGVDYCDKLTRYRLRCFQQGMGS